MDTAENRSSVLERAWQRPLVREVALVICIKLLAIVAIRLAWFSDRPAEKLVPSAVAEVVLGDPSEAGEALPRLQPTVRGQP